MIYITNTPNNTGVAIHGDYMDFEALYNASSLNKNNNVCTNLINTTPIYCLPFPQSYANYF